jgi:hypothetical protein
LKDWYRKSSCLVEITNQSRDDHEFGEQGDAGGNFKTPVEGSVSKVEMDCDCWHTGPLLRVSSSQEKPMTFIAVRCPHCQSNQIVKRGKTARGTQRYLCQNILCAKGSFLLDYCNRGCLPEVKQQIIDMSLNASGIRDTA